VRWSWGPNWELQFIPAETESLGKIATTRQSIAAEAIHLKSASSIPYLIPAAPSSIIRPGKVDAQLLN